MAMPHQVLDLSRDEPFAGCAIYPALIWWMEFDELEANQASVQMLALIIYSVSYYYNG